MLKKLYAVAAVCVALILTLAAEPNSTNRPPNWAHELTVPGAPNFFQVTSNLYRGAQPTSEGMKQLKAMGIKTVITLREFHSDKEFLHRTRGRQEHQTPCRPA